MLAALGGIGRSRLEGPRTVRMVCSLCGMSLPLTLEAASEAIDHENNAHPDEERIRWRREKG